MRDNKFCLGSGPHSYSQNIVILNVGGTIHQVKWDTIDKFPNSRLQRLRYATTECKNNSIENILETHSVRRYSWNPLPLWLLLSRQSWILFRQISQDIREHSGSVPQGRAPPDRERLSQGLCGRAGVLGTERPLPGALLCLHSPEGQLAPPRRGSRGGPRRPGESQPVVKRIILTHLVRLTISMVCAAPD